MKLVKTLIAKLETIIVGASATMLVPVRVTNRRRAAGMLEYALVALISIAVFGILITQFEGILGNLAKNIGEKLKGL